MSKKCNAFKCALYRKNENKGEAVWAVDGVPYCNTCMLNWMDSGQWGRQNVVRLYDDEVLYVDMRIQKRRKRSREPNPCGPPIELRV